MYLRKTPVSTLFMLLLLLIGISTSGAHAQQGEPEDTIVGQFFPQWLISEANDDFSNGGPPPFKVFAYEDVDFNRTGIPQFIVAAYSNGFSGVVRVLQKQGASAVQVAAPSFPLMGGVYPSVRTIDVDSDGIPEAVVSFSSARGPGADWVLKWTGANLKSIGPVSVDEDGDIATLLSEADFTDLNGDGILEIISASQSGPTQKGQPATVPLNVFSLSNGTYTHSSVPLNLFAIFVRDTGKPKTAIRKFSVADPSKQYVMTIVNGDMKGRNPVSSGEIQLNGAIVAVPNLFNRQVRIIKVPVIVNKSNTITVKLNSAPGSELAIGIGPQ